MVKDATIIRKPAGWRTDASLVRLKRPVRYRDGGRRRSSQYAVLSRSANRALIYPCNRMGQLKDADPIPVA